MAGVGIGCGIHWAGVMRTCLGGVLSCVIFSGTMGTFVVNASGVSVGTLRDGAGESIWSAPADASRVFFGVQAIRGFSVTFEKMRKSVCMAANCLFPNVAKGVLVSCKRALANARVAVVAALVELQDGTGKSCGNNSTVLAMRSARVHRMYTRWHW